MPPAHWISELRALIKNTQPGSLLDYNKAKEANGGSHLNLSTRLHTIAEVDGTLQKLSQRYAAPAVWKVIARPASAATAAARSEAAEADSATRAAAAPAARHSLRLAAHLGAAPPVAASAPSVFVDTECAQLRGELASLREKLAESRAAAHSAAAQSSRELERARAEAAASARELATLRAQKPAAPERPSKRAREADSAEAAESPRPIKSEADADAAAAAAESALEQLLQRYLREPITVEPANDTPGQLVGVTRSGANGRVRFSAMTFSCRLQLACFIPYAARVRRLQATGQLGALRGLLAALEQWELGRVPPPDAAAFGSVDGDDVEVDLTEDGVEIVEAQPEARETLFIE